MTSANGRGPPVAATAVGAPGGRSPDAAPPGPVTPLGADALAVGAAAPLTKVWNVVQPVSAALAATRAPRARAGVKRGMAGWTGNERVRWYGAALVLETGEIRSRRAFGR